MPVVHRHLQGCGSGTAPGRYPPVQDRGRHIHTRKRQHDGSAHVWDDCAHAAMLCMLMTGLLRCTSGTRLNLNACCAADCVAHCLPAALSAHIEACAGHALLILHASLPGLESNSVFTAARAAACPAGKLQFTRLPAQLHLPLLVAEDLCTGTASCPSSQLPAEQREAVSTCCPAHDPAAVLALPPVTLTWSSCLVCSQKR